MVYPQFETRGDLVSTVHRFREWLTNKVVDLEIEKGSKNPTVDNGVRVVILGHSMGGIVGAEAVLAIAGKTPTVASAESVENADMATTAGAQEPNVGAPKAGMEGKEEIDAEEAASAYIRSDAGVHTSDDIAFPYIAGLLAFDTPYLGLSPSMISHGAETHWNTGKGIYDTASSLLGSFRSMSPAPAAKAPAGALPAPSASDAAAASASAGGWGKLALYGGAAASLAGVGAAAAYFNRKTIGNGVTSATAGLTSGWTWVSSHLEFVGCLARAEELQRRLAGICAMAEVQETSVSRKGASQKVVGEEKEHMGRRTRPLGFGNFYTVLGKGADRYAGGAKASGIEDRRFCNMPRGDALRKHWFPARNEIAKDEVTAHMTMFGQFLNPVLLGHLTTGLTLTQMQSRTTTRTTTA